MKLLDAPIPPVTMALIAGIIIGEYIDSMMWTLILTAALLGFSLLFRYHPRWQTALLLMTTTGFGCSLRIWQEHRINTTWPSTRQQWEVVVCDEPLTKDRFTVINAWLPENGEKVKCTIERTIDSDSIRVGDGLLIDAKMKAIRPYNNGHFNYQRFMHSRGYVGEAYVSNNRWNWTAVNLGKLSRWQRMRLRFMMMRHSLLNRIDNWHLSNKVNGVVKAMVLGDRTELNPTIKETYTMAGASHVLALSGMHLGIIYFIITLLMRWRRLELLSQAIIVVTLWGYALLVGLSPSVTRSALMISIYAIFSISGRDNYPINLLAFTANICLLINPLSLYDISFQLSYMAVLSILVLSSLCSNMVNVKWQMKHPVIKWIGGILLVSLAAQLGTAPLAAYHFGTFNTCALPTNLFLIPMATATIWLTLINLIACQISPLAIPCTWMLEHLVDAMNNMLKLFTKIPYNHIEFEPFGVTITLFLYLSMGIMVFFTIKYLKKDVYFK